MCPFYADNPYDQGGSGGGGDDVLGEDICHCISVYGESKKIKGPHHEQNCPFWDKWAHQQQCFCAANSTERGPHHDKSCPLWTDGKLKCSICEHTMDVAIDADQHWYKNHYSHCSSYGICNICNANIRNGEPHERDCKFSKCTCGNKGRPGQYHDPDCPKYIQVLYPICEYCGKNGEDIKNHLIWCPNYNGSESYDTCVLCGQTKGHKNTCVYALQEAPKSDKMCTREEIYEFLFKHFKNKKILVSEIIVICLKNGKIFH